MATTQTATRYRWAELSRDQPMNLLDRARVIGEHVMLSEVRLQKGCFVPTHAHANEQFACIISGRLRFGIGDEADPERREVIVEGGEVMHLPPNIPHSAEALQETLVIDVFSPTSEKTGIDGA
jgi:quercetin dioxygenase-like cupin family protein